MKPLIHTPQDRILLDVQAERLRQDSKWGIQNHDDKDWFPILVEEIGEVAKDLAERGEATSYEIVHVAAVAVAWLECKERKSRYPRPGPGQTTLEEQIEGLS